MCMSQSELSNTSNENLLQFYKRSIELQEGKSPHDREQLSTEILRRMNEKQSVHEPPTRYRQAGDGHDEFS